MGFSKKLKKENLNEWKKWYMDYDMLVGLINDEHEFIKHYLQEINKVEEFYKYAEKELIKGKNEVKDMLHIKNEEDINLTTEIENETKLFLLQPMDAGSCFGDTNSSTSSHSGNSTSTEEDYNKRKQPMVDSKYKNTKEENELRKIEEEIKKNEKNKKRLKKKREEIKREKILESEIDEEREPDTEEEKKEINKPKLTWKDKILAQKDKLFFNNIFKTKYDKAKKEKALLEFIASTKHVIRYRNLNLLGFRKVLIKYDHLKDRNISYVLLPILEKTHFAKSREIDNSIKIASNKFKEVYHKNDPRKADEILRNINRKQKANQFIIFLLGVFLTVSCFIHYRYFYDLQSNLQFNYYFSVISILLGSLLFGICCVIFKFYSINSSFIFEFTVGSRFINDKYLFYVSSLILIHQLTTIYFYKNSNSLLSLIIVVIQLFPAHIYYLRSRYYLVGALVKVFLPLFQVKFKHFFLADVVCSHTAALKFFMISCGIKNDSSWMLLLLYPSTIRIFQCLRRFYDEGFKTQLYNALKYLCSFISTAFILYLSFSQTKNHFISYTLLGIASFYSLIWDLIFDWNIFRNEYIFPRIIYPLVVLFNIFIRFIWLYKEHFKIHDFYCLMLEIFRRYLWLLVRVEIEHLYNCNRLTAMKYVNIKREELFYVKDYEPLNSNLDTEPLVSNAEV